ncbi:hypothetical protein [Streptomyces sp. NPDC058583]|uniref:hypothetical protein n=1 Tax=unclassified Streptomyces TaxID=2593676 RepID=UPI00365168BF
MPIDPNLAVAGEDLKRLADDLDAMRTYIDGQVRRMDAITATGPRAAGPCCAR